MTLSGGYNVAQESARFLWSLKPWLKQVVVNAVSTYNICSGPKKHLVSYQLLKFFHSKKKKVVYNFNFPS